MDTKQITVYFVKPEGGEWTEYKSVSKAHVATGIARTKLTKLFENPVVVAGYTFRTELRVMVMSAADKWRLNNKDRTSKYNKHHITNAKENTSVYVISAKKIVKGDEPENEWVEYATQVAAATACGVATGNITRVLQGKATMTGGYLFKKELRAVVVEKSVWADICTENDYGNASKGGVSKHRTLHETKENIAGKSCCTCKLWKPLEQYNLLTTHWDGLRTDCKECLTNYRNTPERKVNMAAYSKEYWTKTKETQTKSHRIWKNNNREHVNEYNRIYMRVWEKNKRDTDPSYKLLKNMRNRLWSALKSNSGTPAKGGHTMELCGCTILELRAHLEKKFTDGMTWDNYGEVWHCDHIIPCASWDFNSVEQQQICFNYANLQPLFVTENLSKGANFNDIDKEAYIASVLAVEFAEAEEQENLAV